MKTMPMMTQIVTKLGIQKKVAARLVPNVESLIRAGWESKRIAQVLSRSDSFGKYTNCGAMEILFVAEIKMKESKFESAITRAEKLFATYAKAKAVYGR